MPAWSCPPAAASPPPRPPPRPGPQPPCPPSPPSPPGSSSPGHCEAGHEPGRQARRDQGPRLHGVPGGIRRQAEQGSAHHPELPRQGESAAGAAPAGSTRPGPPRDQAGHIMTAAPPSPMTSGSPPPPPPTPATGSAAPSPSARAGSAPSPTSPPTTPGRLTSPPGTRPEKPRQLCAPPAATAGGGGAPQTKHEE